YDVMPGWNLFGSYLFGATQAQPSATSAFNNVSDMTSDSFAVTATKDEVIGHDRLSFSVGQPTRVRSGIASGLTQQVDRQTGTIGVAEFEQSLVPTGRTIQFQGAYQKELSDKINLNFALKYETQPYQQKDADADASGLVKLMYKM
ncbi:MAG: hypothetical protein JWM96_290, partial [Alphaproteobacteria bacterium]|nr:hypothetical protein [Alphaproteobacteria bacterium]